MDIRDFHNPLWESQTLTNWFSKKPLWEFCSDQALCSQNHRGFWTLKNADVGTMNIDEMGVHFEILR